MFKQISYGERENLISVSKDELEKTLHKQQFVWVDLEKPTQEDLDFLNKLINLHPLSIEETLASNKRQKFREFPEYVFLVFHESLFDGTKFSEVELDVFLGKNFVITAYAEKSKSLEELKARYKKQPRLFEKGSVFFLYLLFDSIVENYFPIIEKLSDSVEKVETEIFSKADKKTLSRLFTLKKNLLKMRRKINPQRDIITKLASSGSEFISSEYILYFKGIEDRLIRISEIIDTYREIVADARDAHLSMISNKLSEIMKLLTIIATIILPLTLVTGFYGMNVSFVEYDLFGQRGTYLFALAVIAIIATTMIYYFKKNGWI